MIRKICKNCKSWFYSDMRNPYKVGKCDRGIGKDIYKYENDEAIVDWCNENFGCIHWKRKGAN